MRVLGPLAVLILASAGVGAAELEAVGPPLCVTDGFPTEKPETRGAATLSCPMQGFCDHPLNRDTAIPDEDTPVRFLTVNFQTLNRDDGSEPAFSRAGAQRAVDALNGCFEPWRIQFDFDHRMVYSDRYHTIEDDWRMVDEFGQLFATDPLRSLNIVSTFFWCEWQGQWTLCGGAPYIWTHSPGDAKWHVLMTPNHWYARDLICHEVGHAFGLIHTFGDFWVEPCDPCDEVVGATNRDMAGDFCSDTPPTPVDPWNTLCANAPGTDPCSGLPWGETDYRNYMAYTPAIGCWDHFTPQQAGRMHCWMGANRIGWISYVAIRPDVDFGPAPLRVSFEGLTSMDAHEWSWEFGDGVAGDDASPTHVYHSPGVYRPQVEIDAVEGVFDADMSRDVWVADGEVMIGSVEARPGDPLIEVPIRITNSVPVDFVDLPLHWDGPAGLTLEAIGTAGLPSQHFPAPSWLDHDPVAKRGCLRLYTFDTLALEPGTHVLLKLELAADPDGPDVAVNRIRLESYDGCSMTFATDRGPFTPTAINGRVLIRSTTIRIPSGRRQP